MGSLFKKMILKENGYFKTIEGFHVAKERLSRDG